MALVLLVSGFSKGELPVEKMSGTICLLIQKMHKELTAFLISSLQKSTSCVLDFGLKHTAASSDAN